MIMFMSLLKQMIEVFRALHYISNLNKRNRDWEHVKNKEKPKNTAGVGGPLGLGTRTIERDTS